MKDSVFELLNLALDLALSELAQCYKMPVDQLRRNTMLTAMERWRSLPEEYKEAVIDANVQALRPEVKE